MARDKLVIPTEPQHVHVNLNSNLIQKVIKDNFQTMEILSIL